MYLKVIAVIINLCLLSTFYGCSTTNHLSVISSFGSKSTTNVFTPINGKANPSTKNVMGNINGFLAYSTTNIVADAQKKANQSLPGAIPKSINNGGLNLPGSKTLPDPFAALDAPPLSGSEFSLQSMNPFDENILSPLKISPLPSLDSKVVNLDSVSDSIW